MQYQNTLRSPLHQLPAELLQGIMSFAAEGRPLLTEIENSDAEDSDDGDPLERGWLSLGHVNSHVRTILLAMRELWASAICSTSSHTVLAEVLLRAGENPLSLRLNEDTPFFLWPFALKNLQKAQHIDVKFFDDDDHAIYEGLCELQLPLLQALRASIAKASDEFVEHEPPWMRGFHLKTIHVLGLQLEAEMVQRPGIYGEIFDHFPGVQRLELLNPVEPMVAALSHRQDAITTQPTETSVPRHLPLLSELILGVNPDDKYLRDTHHDAPTIGERKEGFSEALLALAGLRAVDASSSPLECISLRQSNGSEDGMDPDVIEQMRRHVRVENDLE